MQIPGAMVKAAEKVKINKCIDTQNPSSYTPIIKRGVFIKQIRSKYFLRYSRITNILRP